MRRGCCGLGTCQKPDCYLCTVVAKLPQPEGTRERQSAYAVPDPSKKKPVKHPMFTRRYRKALTR